MTRPEILITALYELADWEDIDYHQLTEHFEAHKGLYYLLAGEDLSNDERVHLEEEHPGEYPMAGLAVRFAPEDGRTLAWASVMMQDQHVATSLTRRYEPVPAGEQPSQSWRWQLLLAPRLDAIAEDVRRYLAEMETQTTPAPGSVLFGAFS